jgi:hypothetical protein
MDRLEEVRKVVNTIACQQPTETKAGAVLST